MPDIDKKEMHKRHAQNLKHVITEMLLSNKPTTIAFNGMRNMLYIVLRNRSGTISLLTTPIEGKYKPTQNSKSKNVAKDTINAEVDEPLTFDATANAAMPAMKAAFNLVAGEDMLPSKVDAEAPHMHAIMNIEKITPCGGGTVSLSKAGVQLKTKANIDPSKQATRMLRRSIRMSVKSNFVDNSMLPMRLPLSMSTWLP